MQTEKVRFVVGMPVRGVRAQFRAADTAMTLDIDWDELIAPLNALFPHCDAIAAGLDPKRSWSEDVHLALVRLEGVIQHEIDRLKWERRMHDAYLRDVAQRKAKADRQRQRRSVRHVVVIALPAMAERGE